MPEYYTCTVCQKFFQSPKGLARHMRIHTGEEPFSCDTCGTKFKQKYYLTRHKRTHTDEKPFSCDTCGKTFKVKHHLIRHERTHTGETPYPCETCGKAFKRKDNLRRHIQIIHQGRVTAVTTQSHEEPAGTVTSTTHTFSTPQTNTVITYVSSTIGDARVVIQQNPSTTTTSVTQSGETISYIENRDLLEQEAVEALLKLGRTEETD